MMEKLSLASRLFELASVAAPRLAEARDPLKADLRESGLTSVAAVRLMLEVEAAFDIAIPDVELTPENFSSIASMETLVRRLKPAAAA